MNDVSYSIIDGVKFDHLGQCVLGFSTLTFLLLYFIYILLGDRPRL